jgi:hypothetical protein
LEKIGIKVNSLVETIRHPKNYGKIFSTAKQMLDYMRESDSKTWLDKYEPLWSKKLEELASFVFEDSQLRRYISFRDLWDDMLRIGMITGKAPKDISDADLARFLDRFFRDPETYSFYFPASELDFPDEYKVGACDLHSFKQLPRLVRVFYPPTSVRVFRSRKYMSDG